jgi:hypothetical protein
MAKVGCFDIATIAVFVDSVPDDDLDFINDGLSILNGPMPTSGSSMVRPQVALLPMISSPGWRSISCSRNRSRYRANVASQKVLPCAL